ncbi:hypothetical protein JVU11DRAFT_4915 [Chiua virens]|nr:hypothetical protein JVU11DRAFT_4915 [Chiua virens]
MSSPQFLRQQPWTGLCCCGRLDQKHIQPRAGSIRRSSLRRPEIRVGVDLNDEDRWKTPDNIFRKAPWNITSIPTIIKLNEVGEEIGRLVDGRNSIPEELATFLQ